jgi:RNA polymerase sigma-70 factor (ECF subfamily)
MSSDITTYFPGVLTSASEVPGPSHTASEFPSGHPASVSQPRLGISEPSTNGPIRVPEISDEVLLEQVALGEKEALAQLFRRHARTVRNVAFRILRNEEEAADLVQDVFLYLFRKAGLFNRSRGRALSWIVQVTYHRAFDRRRRLISRHFYASLAIEEGALQVPDRSFKAPSSEWSLEDVWGRESAAELRGLLSPSQLVTIELYFFEGFTLEEIAERLGQTLGNVRHHYYRGLEKLRKPAFAEKLRSK